MEIKANTQLYDTILNSLRDKFKDRQGIHLSDLIFCLRKAYFRKMLESPPATEEQLMLFATGFAFQSWMFPGQEKEYELDGIKCSPDAHGIEFKTTRASIAKFNVWDMEHWLRQIKGYCKVLELIEFDLVVLFLMGSYKPPFPTLGTPFHLIFTQQEINDNWAYMLNRKSILEYALTMSIPPVQHTEMDWEGKFCAHKELQCKDFNCGGIK